MTHMLQDLDARAGRSGGAEQAAPTRLSSLLDARVLLAAALGVFLSQLYMQRFFLHDDALISLRFARSFVGTGAFAYSGPCRPPIPTHSGHLFRRMSATVSDRSRPPLK